MTDKEYISELKQLEKNIDIIQEMIRLSHKGIIKTAMQAHKYLLNQPEYKVSKDEEIKMTHLAEQLEADEGRIKEK